jgi:hypothetical protein
MPTMKQITTADADLITYHAAITGKLPQFHLDQLTGKVVADVPLSSRDAFQDDAQLQRFLSAKKAVWKSISELRSKGVSRG